jgi:hypothetical protein
VEAADVDAERTVRVDARVADGGELVLHGTRPPFGSAMGINAEGVPVNL